MARFAVISAVVPRDHRKGGAGGGRRVRSGAGVCVTGASPAVRTVRDIPEVPDLRLCGLRCCLGLVLVRQSGLLFQRWPQEDLRLLQDEPPERSGILSRWISRLLHGGELSGRSAGADRPR